MENTTVEMETVPGKGKIRFYLPRHDETPVRNNKTAMKWKKRIQRRRMNQMAIAEANEFSIARLQEYVAKHEERIAQCTDDTIDTWYQQVFGTTDCVNDGPTTTPENTGIYDTGCTSGVTTSTDAQLMQPTGRRSNKVFHMPLGNSAQATEVYEMNHKLRRPAMEMNELPGLHSTLISGVKLADADYVSVIDKEKVNVYDAKTTNVKATGPPVLQGWRVGNLWRIPLVPKVMNVNTETRIVECPSVKEAIANVFEMPTVAKLIAYFHAAAGYPVMSTWIKAIDKGNYATWPGLTASAVRKHYPETEATMAGHMHGTRQGIKSTKAREAVSEEIHNSTEPKKKTHEMMVKVVDLQETIYTDQTGMFPYLSSRGNRYLMVAIHVDANYIFLEPMRNRTEHQIVGAYQAIFKRMQQAGLSVKKHILDNEASALYKDAIKQNNVTHELVPPNNHRRNIAERSIQTGKNHIVSVLCGCHNDFPMHLWCRLLPNIEWQINLLRQSNVAPNVSAYAHVHGQHDFLRQPFAPLGCPVQVHVPPANRKSWAKHTESGWHLGTSNEHYRCFREYINKTKSERISDTVFFQHKHLTQPMVTKEDAVIAAAKRLHSTILGQVDPANEHYDRLKNLSDMFNLIANEKAKEATKGGSPKLKRRDEVPLPCADPSSLPTANTAPIPRVEINNPAPPLTVEYHQPPSIPDYTSGPANNTRSKQQQVRTVTQECLLSAIELTQVRVSPQQLAARRFPMQLLCEMAGAVMDTNGELLEYRQLVKREEYRPIWRGAMGKEVGRLAQGLKTKDGKQIVEGTNTIFFINKDQVPQDRRRDVTYARICANYRPEKADPYRIRLTMGGDRINYPGAVSTPTADLITVKLLLNSIVSTPGAKCFTMDIKNFYLMTPMERYEYLRIKMDDIPDEVIEQYDLNSKSSKDGYVYVEVRRGMYGLPHAGLIAQELLEERMAKHGYHQSENTPGLWSHEWRPIQFCLTVDDFLVKYIGEEHAQHLINAVSQDYEMTHDLGKDDQGGLYCGITMDWDYQKREVHLSMPGYVKEALKRFQHELTKIQNQPHPHVPPRYGEKIQYAKPQDDSPKLSATDKKFIQQVTGTFLFYARAVDSTMLTALSAIASQQADPTEHTMKLCKQFLDYAASQEEAILTYRASDMILAIHSDASYLSEPKARSRAGGHFFLAGNEDIPRDNGAILNVSQVIKAVMSSAAEAELGALFINAKIAVPMRTTLVEMGHAQPRTPLQTDNSTAHGVLTKKMMPKATKAMDMRFHWLRCRDAQGQFRYYWRPGTTNKADYWTKHHPAAHHVNIRKEILTSKAYYDAFKRRIQNIKLKLTNARKSARVC